MNGCSQECMPEATLLMWSKVQDVKSLHTPSYPWTNNCRIFCLTHTMSLVNRNVNRSPFSNLEMSRGKSIEFGFGPTWVYIPAGLLTSWVALDLGRELTRTQCPHQLYGLKDLLYSEYLTIIRGSVISFTISYGFCWCVGFQPDLLSKKKKNQRFQKIKKNLPKTLWVKFSVSFIERRACLKT